ncbi:flagellin N-terminal helical domain-containing protein [Parablautia muri]|uniref:Flagellin n=1 Tax=Parablautia muri TaxID=2320879 RepID=A0A9X5BIB6_9FIRM|nr:flagellin [Parablautia muri]NBJ94199.1 flagellin FliC3 [Parablautia muri]
MKINFNASAVIATNQMTKNDNRLQQSLERLSSGLKIVHAKDNPSGLAMAKRMNAQIEGVTQATQNAGDGISVVEIADGALAEVHEMLQRINELAVKASTESLTSGDREMIEVEVKQLKEEITRISRDTEFNGQRILDGSFDLKGYTDNENVKVTYYSDTLKSGKYHMDLDVTFKADGTVDTADYVNGTGPYIPADAKVSQIDGNIVTIKGSQNFELKLRVSEDAVTAGGNRVSVDMEITGFGSMDMQIGANEGQQLDIIIPEVSLENMGIKHIDLSTKEDSDDALRRMGGAVHFVSSVRGRLGAYQNRLEHTINTLDITNENMTGAYSRIMDADMAEEMTEYTTLQVLAQASTSMLAQANERPSQVLQLLQ